MTQVEFGWLIRNIHSWSANLLILAVFAHLFSVFFLKAYRKPRELTWITGVLLLFVMLGFGFSGYLLPWNELAFFATKVGTGIAGAVPVIGGDLMRFMRGGDDVTGATLSRFYALHIAILPAVATLLVGAASSLRAAPGHERAYSDAQRIKQGERVRQMPFFPDYILRDVLLWYVAIALLAALAAFYPWELGRKADAFAPVPAGIRPEWYFLAMFHTLKLLPSHILGIEGEVVGVVGFGLAAIGLLLVPFLDRRAAEESPAPSSRHSVSAGSCISLRSRSSGIWRPDMTRLSTRFAATTMGLLLVGSFLGAAHAWAQAPADGCVSCHAALPQSELSSPVTAFRTDVHNERGFRCVDCHGGDPTTQDKARAKDPARGYRGKPRGTQIVTTCARCHSDASLMRKFAPAGRVDQAAEYATSIHGIRLAKGDREGGHVRYLSSRARSSASERRAIPGVPDQCRVHSVRAATRTRST